MHILSLLWETQITCMGWNLGKLTVFGYLWQGTIEYKCLECMEYKQFNISIGVAFLVHLIFHSADSIVILVPCSSLMTDMY